MAAPAKARKRGRPALPPNEKKRPSMGFRPSPANRKQIEQAAAKSGLSMSQEIERRLERSFAEETNLQWAYQQIIGDEALHRAIMLASSLIRISQEETGVPWHQDPELRKEAADLYRKQLDTEAARLNADADKVPSGKTRKSPARKRVVRK